MEKEAELENIPEDKTLIAPLKKVASDFDELIDILGPEGKFQKIMLYGVLCPITVICPFIVLTNLFMLYIPNHWCYVPGRNDTDLEVWKNMTLPIEQGPDGLPRYSQCKMFDEDENEIGCLHGWEFDTKDYDATIPSEFNWVCDKMHYATRCFTMGSLGGAAGTVVFGILADKIGRKPVFIISCLLNFANKSLSIFFPHRINAYLFFQFIGGMAFFSIFNSPTMIAAETCGRDYRAWIYAAVWMVWVIGNSFMPFLAWVTRNWFLFGMISTIPAAILFCYFPFLLESPRWLLTTRRTKEARKILLRIAKINGTMDKLETEIDLDESLEQLAEKLSSGQKGCMQVLSLFSKKRVAVNTILVSTSWAINMLLYYGVTLNTTEMAGNQFLNYFLLSLVELPAGMIAGKLANTTGRRWTQAAFFFFCSSFCLLCAIAVNYPTLSWVVIAGALGIKLGVSITTLIVCLQAMEIFPTQLRSTGTGFASTVSSFVGVAGPHIVYMGKFHVAAPYLILGALSFIGSFIASSLPETLHQKLPETLEDASRFGKGVKFWSYLPKAIQERRNSRKNSIKNPSLS